MSAAPALAGATRSFPVPPPLTAAPAAITAWGTADGFPPPGGSGGANQSIPPAWGNGAFPAMGTPGCPRVPPEPGGGGGVGDEQQMTVFTNL